MKLKYIETLIKNYPELISIKESILSAVDLLYSAFAGGNKLLLCGNGGSAADCEHISGELMKGFLLKRTLNDEDISKFKSKITADNLQYGLPCIPLNSLNSLLTAVANDNCADVIFAQGVYSLGKYGDVLIALSTSGNSANIICAADAAKSKGMAVIAITGETDSELAEMADVTLKMPSTETYRIQEYTLPVYHAVCAEIEECFFG